jgi:DNA polymerase III alpha subunit (gram-positive type)
MKLDNYVLYVLDTETTNLEPDIGDIVELSIRRVYDDSFKTLYMRAVNINGIDPAALRVNGHKLEDITWRTDAGRSKYLDPKIALVELENFLMDDDMVAEQRILVGQNIPFDINHLRWCYKKNADISAYPFGKYSIDTAILEFVGDLAQNKIEENYSLHHLNKRHGIKNDAAHTAEADAKATKDLFIKQIDKLKKLYAKNKD